MSFTAPSAISIDTVPLQSVKSLAESIDVLDCSKFDNTSLYCCDTTCVEPFTVADTSFAVTLVNVFVIPVVVSLSTNTAISFAVT